MKFMLLFIKITLQHIIEQKKDHWPYVVWNIAFRFWRSFMLFCTSVIWLL